MNPSDAAPPEDPWAGAELPRHMQPARIEARPSLPRLTSGKYDVPALTGRDRGAA